MSKKDPILLEKIDQLERELAEKNQLIRKLQGFSRITKPIKDLWEWWTEEDGRVGGTIALCFFSSVGLLLLWGLGGWATDRFYVDSCPCSPDKYNVYQEYNWGKDENHGACGNTIDACIQAAEAKKADWLKYQGYKQKGLAE